MEHPRPLPKDYFCFSAVLTNAHCVGLSVASSCYVANFPDFFLRFSINLRLEVACLIHQHPYVDKLADLQRLHQK
jgi:hypothetical protein